MMKNALNEISRETGCRVIFLAIPQAVPGGGVVVTAAWAVAAEEPSKSPGSEGEA